MKIVHVVPDFGLGGIQKGGCTLAIGMGEQNHQVMVLAQEGGPRQQALLDRNINAVVVPKKQLLDAISAFAPDVAHIHGPSFDVPLINGLCGRTVVVSTPVFGRPPATGGILQKTKICCVGEFAAWRLWRWLGRPENAEIFWTPITPFHPPNGGQSGTDKIKILDAKQRLTIPAHAFVVGRLGRADIYKWHPKTHWIVDKILSETADAFWLSIGMPSECGVDALKRKFQGRFLNFEQTSDFERIADIVQCMDLHIFASRFGECFSASIVESMGIGVPCAAICKPLGDSGEIEQIRPNIDGLLAATPEGLVECAKTLMADRPRAAKLGINAKLRVERDWNYKPATARLLAAYECWHRGKKIPETLFTDASLAQYEQVHFERMKSAIGADFEYALRCLISRYIYTNYPAFSLARRFKSSLNGSWKYVSK